MDTSRSTLPACCRHTRIVARTELEPTLIDPSPLGRFGSYATTATCSVNGIQFFVATVHALARTADASEIGQLDADQIRRPDVSEPWVNDVAFALLQPAVTGHRFILGADLNTSRLFPGGPSFFSRAGENGWVDR